MTDQERPVEERNELPDSLLNTASVAVHESAESAQEHQAADEQPEPAAQPTAASVVETMPAATEPTATIEEHTTRMSEEPVSYAEADANTQDATAPAADSSGQATGSEAQPEDADATEAMEPAATVPSPDAAEALTTASATALADDSFGQATESEAQPEATVPPAALADESFGQAAESEAQPEAPDAPERMEAAATAPLNGMADDSSSQATASETQREDADASAPMEPAATTLATELTEAAGASYTPVDEAAEGHPRRVKDLEPGMELEGRVTSIALYGIFVDIGVGRDGLVHISEMSDTRIDSPSDIVQIGDTVNVRVKSVEPDGRRISLTMRSKDRGEQRARGRKRPELNRDALATLKVGENVEGTVTGIASFGVFVDIGVGKDGLVHVSELAEGRIDKPEDAVQIGQSYNFKILEVDADGTRISLSLRRAQRGQRMQQLEKGQILEGTVSGLAPFGAFVDIGVGRDGLIHISEMSEGRIGKVEDAVKVGDKISVRVIEVDPQSKRISLSMRLEDRPREEMAPRNEAVAEPYEDRGRREDRSRREDRGPRAPRQEQMQAQSASQANESGADAEEEFEGNATLEDLLSKFSGGKRERKRRQDDEEEEGDEDRYTRRQRDAIRRTLHINEEE